MGSTSNKSFSMEIPETVAQTKSILKDFLNSPCHCELHLTMAKLEAATILSTKKPALSL